MNKDEILIQVFNLLRKKNENFSNYELSVIESKSLNELGMDSLGLVSFMVHLEDEFGIEWDEEKTNTEVLRSISSISNFITKELGYAI